jgi:glucose-1-phosphate thymidylyltransferase
MRQPDAAARLDEGQAAAADAGLKAMIPIRGRPFLDHVLSSLGEAGIAEVCLVVPPGRGPIQRAYERPAVSPMRISFAVQDRPLGTAEALLAAEEFAGGEDFLALNCDNLYPASALQSLQELDGPGLPVFERERLLATSNFPPERVARYAVLEVSDGLLRRIVEKPGQKALAARSGEVLLSMNLWRFSPRIFEACRRVPLSSRGERELPQAVQWAIDHLGERFRAVPCAERVLDLTARSDVATLEAML